MMKNTDHKVKIIELMGPSGSGKSTCVKTALRAGTYDDLESAAWRGLIDGKKIHVPCAWLWRLIPIRLARRLRLVRLVSFYRQELMRSYGHLYEELLGLIYTRVNEMQLPISERSWLLGRVFEAVTDHLLITEPVNNGRVILADEFFLQKIHTLFFDQSTKELNKGLTNAFLDVVPKPDTVLNFKLPVDICRARLRTRGGTLPRMSRDQTATEIEAGLQLGLTTSQHVADYLSSQHSLQVINVIETSDLKKVLAELERT